MHSLAVVFPPENFTLLLAIVALPLLGAFVNGVFGKRLGPEAVSLMALSAVGGSFILSVVGFLMLGDVESEQAVRFVWHGWQWMSISGEGGVRQIPIEAALSLDALSGTMALIVTGVGFLIHLYSTKYMAGDPGYHRFFAYMNLFIFSMLVLILGDNLPILFIGWEGVGLCSYLLIGFWFQDKKNAEAGKKAFITNRIGDFGLLVAMALLVKYAGVLDWNGLESAAAKLVRPVEIWPIIAPDSPLGRLMPEGFAEPYEVSGATLVGLALFLGCAGKSAQLPLYVWLPDAMAGPTPVSALIHAATMVTAGVYLVCRMAGVFVLSPAAMFVIALIGAMTAIFAATIALVQNDIKKVLAYSTVSQLGYMFLGVGVGAFAAGFFHVITHAFFKACLFLGAGSVIHALHVRIHNTDASQDMRNMGGLKAFLPRTYWTFVAAWAAIVAVPGTAGFFSKDAILFNAYTSSVKAPGEGVISRGSAQFESFVWPEGGSTLLFWLGVFGAVLTAFYMTRLVFGIFEGEFRGWTIVDSPAPDHPDAHAHHDPDEPIEGPAPKESPWQMTLPLIVLGGLSIVAGWLNAHLAHIHVFDDWLKPVFSSAAPHVEVLENAEQLERTLLAPGLAALVLGAGFAYWMYMVHRGQPAEALAERFPRLHRWALDKWRVDEFYQATVIWFVDAVAEVCTWIDKWVVDGIVARLTAAVVAGTGALLRLVQTGRVHAYAAVMVGGVALMGWFLLSPQAVAKLEANPATGTYVLKATAGLGYSYRWDDDGDGKFDTEEFRGNASLKVELERNETRYIGLEVKNALGRIASERFEITRPPEDLSGTRPTVIDVNRRRDGRLRGAVRQPEPRRRRRPAAEPGDKP